MKVVIASGNSGKIREIQTLVRSFNIELIPQSDLGISDIPETGLTFIENALLKARHACQQSGLPAIADDSGLAVDALKGAPGIHSARYAGLPSDATKNIEKLLKDLENVAPEQRQAAFHCSLVYLSSEFDPTPLICQGHWRGRILGQAQGKEGFGYDPIFGLLDENRSAAELSLEEKNRFSHRGQALSQLIKLLAQKM